MCRLKYLLFIFAFVIGILNPLLFSAICESSQKKNYSEFKWEEVPFNPADRKITTLRDLNNVFVDISAHVNISVVTVFTDKTVEVNRSNESSFFSTPDRYGTQKKEYHQRGLGSGVIVSEDGYILTNNHVVAGADTVAVRLSNQQYFSAEIIGLDSMADIAVLKIQSDKLTPLSFADSDKLKVGEWVLAVGSPMTPALDNSVTRGIVSAIGRSNVGVANYENFIQTDAAINPGNSGGALVNLDGKLVGINTAIATSGRGFQGVGFAVPINMARNVMDALIKYGIVVRGWIGVDLQDITADIAKAMKMVDRDGALIGDVTKNSPADMAGIKIGDIVVALNNRNIKYPSQLYNSIACIAPGTAVSLKIVRDHQEKIVKVIIGKLESNKISPETEHKLEKLFGFTAVPFNPAISDRYDLDKTLKGVVISKIDPVSVGARAGLREGDLIIKLNRKAVGSMEEFNVFVQEMNQGETVFFQVVRRNKSFFVAFTL